ncbi:branched-chain amino acid transport system permease protein [Azospirillum agricola]|uniref:branched-chain amino acid ABC transporter ATP-binding protein/permease n=1 Tax=Azospirillum agricola TaxID=1720247 RepID=UPI001F2C1052|nr:branched-chain amino acid ABC transporter ATP-binding protein/permease [Azospirillum agricola]MBP2227903.1 branched-chain amino acid transport system permease protein [Azospirillum agricola]
MSALSMSRLPATGGPVRFAGLAILAAGAALPLLPGVPEFWITLLNAVGLSALVAMGLVVLTGVGGLTSFGQAAFCGFGAYTTAVLSTVHGVSPWLTLVAALLLTGAAALLLGLLTVRLSGHYLPLGTMAWGISLFYLFGNLDALGRHDGISDIPPLSVAGHALYDGRSVYYVIWGIVALAALATVRLLDSRVGRTIRALRGGVLAAEASGVDTARAKLVAFVYAALLAAVSGWLFAHVQRAVNPTPFGLNAGIEYLFMAVVGGVSHIGGAVLGAGLVLLLKDQLQVVLPWLFGGSGNYESIVFGGLLVLLLQHARGGLWPLAARLLPAPAAPAVDPAAEPLPRRSLPERGRPLLEIDDLQKSFGGLAAVRNVGFSVAAGEIVGLIGPNGAGKSTTFNLITGVLRPSGGAVRLLGSGIGGLPARAVARRGVARSFQHVKLLPEMSVLDNVMLGAHLRGRAGVLRAVLRLDRAEEARLRREAAVQLERCGLGDSLHRPAGTLALGQSRIVEIARALCLDPLLLLLDEPAAGLRHAEKQALGALLRRLREEGTTILLVEHDMDFVMGLVDRLVVMEFGARIAEGVPADIRNDPAVLDAYLGGIE